MAKSKADPFRRHFEYLLTESEVEQVSSEATWKKTVKFPVLGDAIFAKASTSDQDEVDFGNREFSPSHFRPTLRSALDLSPLQEDMLSILTNYQDLFYSDFTTSTSRKRRDEIARLYSLHALNHVLKSRYRILKNNTKLRQRSATGDKPEKSDKSGKSIDGADQKSISGDHVSIGSDHASTRRDPISISSDRKSISDDQEEMFGDQGLTRPKVLILLPFRYMALTVVRTMIDALFSEKSEKKKALIMNKKRFFDEYGAEEMEEKPEDEPTPSNSNKRPRLERPLDYKETFRGNIDDCFRLGLSVGKGGSIKLYTEFYQSDVILASPLGLRMALGAEGEKEYDYDFLSSIEVLILDRADVFLMQNWSHVLHIMQHLHRQPRESHGIDFSRVRLWNLNGWSKYYRQTIVFSTVTTPELRSVFSQHCRNYEGRVFASNEKKAEAVGSLARVIVSAPHAFQRFPCENVTAECEKRFEFFLQKVLPQYADSSMSGTLIYVPSYFDFVRLRNYFKKNDNSVSHVQICEYTSAKKVSRARDLFFHGDKHFLLYTERFHFYHRYKIRGIRNLIFYQLPTYAHFYNEMCNAMLDDRVSDKKRDKASALTCAVLYSQFDALRLAGVLGREKAAELLKSEKSVHVLVTE